MDNLDVQELPELIQQLRRSLQPYIKPKDELKHIRQVLATHLESHVKTVDGSVGRPLSLVESTTQVEQCPNNVKGLHEEYLRSLRANLKAREEHARLRKLDITNTESQHSNARPTVLGNHGDPAAVLDSFLESVKEGRIRDRLTIIQDYFDALGRAPADEPEPRILFKDMDPIPKPPQEILNYASVNSDPDQPDLRELADELEKSVLRAKLLLKKEQKLLAKLKKDAKVTEKISPAQKLRALEMTRNELIIWIEGELVKAGEDTPEADDTEASSASSSAQKIGNIDLELASIRNQYVQYVKARESLVLATTGKLKMEEPDRPTVTTVEAEENESDKSNTKTHVLYPLLEQLVSIANKQKSIIQQKSHFTVSLAKQLKDANEGLDRLAGESHLLPAYPLTNSKTHSQKQSGLITFGDDISSHEKPETSHRARAWTFASETAGKVTDSYVSAKLEEGRIFTAEAGEAILEIRRLLGEDVGGRAESTAAKAGQRASYDDIWAHLDGNLGAINSNDMRG